MGGHIPAPELPAAKLRSGLAATWPDLLSLILIDQGFFFGEVEEPSLKDGNIILNNP